MGREMGVTEVDVVCEMLPLRMELSPLVCLYPRIFFKLLICYFYAPFIRPAAWTYRYEIKNFWIQEVRDCKRSGLPLYPPNVRMQAMNESQQSEDMMSCENCSIKIFKNILLSYLIFILRASSKIVGAHLTTMVSCSSIESSQTPSRGGSQFMDLLKAPAMLFPHLISMRMIYMEGLPLPCPSKWQSLFFWPISEAMKKPELPSLQCSASQVGSRAATSSPLPSYESVDTLIQSPMSEHTQSNHPSPRSSGLLDAIVQESQSLKDSNHYSHHQFPETSVMAGDVFVEYTPVSGGSSSDEPQSAETIQANLTAVLVESDEKRDISCSLKDLKA
ncbi:Transcription factor GAMYB [Bienertia sinuspersici]